MTQTLPDFPVRKKAVMVYAGLLDEFTAAVKARTGKARMREPVLETFMIGYVSAAKKPETGSGADKKKR